jgi:hypothetical protein
MRLDYVVHVPGMNKRKALTGHLVRSNSGSFVRSTKTKKNKNLVLNLYIVYDIVYNINLMISPKFCLEPKIFHFQTATFQPS